MSHEINLEKYQVRTDMIMDYIASISNENIKHSTNKDNDIEIDEVIVEKEVEGIKKGIYKTITFKDITDKDNFKKVQDAVIKNLKDLCDYLKIESNMSCLVIGLGNHKSTPDSLGPKVVDNTLVTRYLYDLGEVDSGYMNVASFKPGVTGVTGIETKDLIKGVVDTVKPDFLIVIDALASSSIDRVNKTIQMTDVGILPGSGVGNSRKELNKEILGIPVIAIGVPTIVDAATIVYDTINYMKKKFSYKLENINNARLKLVDDMHENYLNTKRVLTNEEEEQVLGLVGTLNEVDMKKFILEVLSPINYNLMVTPKEIDFLIDKLALLIGGSINKVLHKSYNTTN